MKNIIRSEKAPAPMGFSHAIVHDLRYHMEVAGQVGLNPETRKVVEGGIGPETEQTLENIKAILSEVGWDLTNILKVRVFLASMEDRVGFSEVYDKYFSEPLPTRMVVEVKKLPLGTLVEMECAAAGDEIKG